MLVPKKEIKEKVCVIMHLFYFWILLWDQWRYALT